MVAKPAGCLAQKSCLVSENALRACHTFSLSYTCKNDSYLCYKQFPSVSSVSWALAFDKRSAFKVSAEPNHGLRNINNRFAAGAGSLFVSYCR